MKRESYAIAIKEVQNFLSDNTLQITYRGDYDNLKYVTDYVRLTSPNTCQVYRAHRPSQKPRSYTDVIFVSANVVTRDNYDDRISGILSYVKEFHRLAYVIDYTSNKSLLLLIDPKRLIDMRAYFIDGGTLTVDTVDSIIRSLSGDDYPLFIAKKSQFDTKALFPNL